MSRPGGARRGVRSDRGVLVLVAGLVLALLAAGAAWAVSTSHGQNALARSAAAATNTPTATLHVLRPGADVRQAGTSAFRNARDRQTLRQGDTVRSNATGSVEIDYADGSLTRLGPSTEFTVARLTEQRGGRQTLGALTTGQTWSRAAKVSETGSFEVKSGGTTAAVEGTAFAFSCTGEGSAHVCTVIDVVDYVAVTGSNGSTTHLTPATGVVSTDDVVGSVHVYTRGELAGDPFIVQNLLLDQAAGKGKGLDDLPASTATTTGAGATTTTAPAIVGNAGATGSTAPPTGSTAPQSTTTLPPPPPPPPTTTLPPAPPSDPRCVDGGWTRRVGAAGQTFHGEQSCSDFGLAGGQFAVSGNGVFVVPRGSAVTLSGTSDGACNTLELGYSVQLDASTTTSGLVGTRREGLPCGGSLGSGDVPTVDTAATAVLLRVFLQDDTCEATRFLSDGDHAGQPTATTVAIMDAAGDCSAEHTPRPPDLGAPVRNFDLLVTVVIGAQPAP